MLQVLKKETYKYLSKVLSCKFRLVTLPKGTDYCNKMLFRDFRHSLSPGLACRWCLAARVQIETSFAWVSSKILGKHGAL
jgi:hypothetical protein